MEHWKDIDGFEGYQVSDHGRVRSFWKVHHGRGGRRYLSNECYIMPMSDDGNGYLKVTLKRGDKNFCRKVRRLVAEAFIPQTDPDSDTVDHIKSGLEGKLDNSVSNLRWISRRENVQKAYRDGRHDARIFRSMRDVILTDLQTGYEWYFDSVCDAADFMNVHQSSVSHTLARGGGKISHFIVETPNREDRLLYSTWEARIASEVRDLHYD